MCLDGHCVEDCGEGFFTDQESRDCEPCHAACRTCGGPRYNDCDSCREGSKLKDGECLDRRQLIVCPEKYFANSTPTAPSMFKSICFEGVSPNVSMQRMCTLFSLLGYSHHILHACSMTLVMLFLFVLSCVVQGDCEQCHISCKTCFAPFKENCSSCDSGKDVTF